MKQKLTIFIAFMAFTVFSLSSCNQANQQNSGADAENNASKTQEDNSLVANAELPIVLIYNFHVTNRCASCMAIQEATTKTLTSYFSEEVKQGRIKRQILNVDDTINNAISEKYQAFGSGIFITRVYNGDETTTDLTGDGFKYARNKEEKFIEIVKNTISDYLKKDE